MIVYSDDQLREILTTMRVIAMVGLSNDSEHDSYKVAEYLIEKGFKIVPINPKWANILGEESYTDLISAQKDLPLSLKIDMVNIFRKSENVPPHVDEAIQIDAKVIWMQEGIEHNDAAKKATDQGIKVIMNKCIMHEHLRLFGR